MTSVPSNIAAEQALLRQNVALSTLKQANDQAQALVEILDEASRNAPVNQARGTNVNINA